MQTGIGQSQQTDSREDRSQHKNQNKHKPMEEHERRNQLVRAIKDNYTMICFDICDFYPSITNTLLQKALNYASKYADISEDQIHLITHTKKTTLYKDGNPWEKTTSAFDVTMGSYDGAEICELVGLYLLSQLQNLNNKRRTIIL